MIKKFSIIVMLFLTSQLAISQTIIRQTYGCLGSSLIENGIIFRQTVGQLSNTEIINYEKSSLRQGFQQAFSNISFLEFANYNININAYPNPFQNNINLNVFGDELEIKILITDIFGRELFSEFSQSNNIISINTIDYSSGLYFLCIYHKDKLLTVCKIVKNQY